METPTWPESLPSNRIQAIQELIQGQELVSNLYEMLWRPKIESDPILEDGVVVQILGMFENTLSVMRSCSSIDPQLRHLPKDFHSSGGSDGTISKDSDESQSTLKPGKIRRGCDNRSTCRKNSRTSTEVTSFLIDDGHAWRKYGQKQILNSKHQRNYYRCTYKIDQGCRATKHVQKIMDNPPKYKTTYIGQHTCNNLQRAPPIILDSSDPSDTSILLSFKTMGFTEKKQIDPSQCSLKHNSYSSSNNHLSWNPNTQVSFIKSDPESVTSSGLNHGHQRPLAVHSGYDNGDMTSSAAYSSMNSTYASEGGEPSNKRFSMDNKGRRRSRRKTEEWNKADLHELFAEVGEKEDLYVVRKVCKVGRKFVFAHFFKVGSLRVLENRLNITRIGNFSLRAKIDMFKKLISDSKKESKRDEWVLDVPSELKQTPMVNLLASLNHTVDESFVIHSLFEPQSLWLSFNNTNCKGIKIDIESKNIIESGSNSIFEEVNDLMGMDLNCINTCKFFIARDFTAEDRCTKVDDDVTSTFPPQVEEGENSIYEINFKYKHGQVRECCSRISNDSVNDLSPDFVDGQLHDFKYKHGKVKDEGEGVILECV
ncbi:DNA-binding WRKY [Artemisia annua]|uniref:DNA-binding WRKY n=1 Tax=Artemisia annua TaxID=35608 RepID=A0A2U1L5V8_ARTAN|nr:DNA-binding WRKY [Artemisia annua]